MLSTKHEQLLEVLAEKVRHVIEGMHRYSADSKSLDKFSELLKEINKKKHVIEAVEEIKVICLKS